MSYAVLPAIFLGVLLAGPGERACSTAYVDFVQRVSDRADQLPAERLAALHRGGLRIFDACDSGHLQNPERTFRSLEQSQAGERLLSQQTENDHDQALSSAGDGSSHSNPRSPVAGTHAC